MTLSARLSLFPVTALVALAALAAAQVRVARLRYADLSPRVGAIDITLMPADPTLADGRPVEMVTLGDSGMAGVGVDRIADTLPALLAARVVARTGRPVHVVGHGRSGARTRDVLEHQVPLIARTPDVAVLLVGTNDVTSLMPPPRLGAVTSDLLASLAGLGIPVVMSSLPDLRAMRALPSLVRAGLELEAVFVRKAQERAACGFADVRSVDVRQLVGAEFVLDPLTMSADRFHPSAAGYGRIADALAPAVAAAVGSRRSTPTGGPIGDLRPLPVGRPECERDESRAAT